MMKLKTCLQLVFAVVLSLALCLCVACDFTGSASVDSGDLESTEASFGSEEKDTLSESEEASTETNSDSTGTEDESESEEPPVETDGIATAEELMALIEKINSGELPNDMTIELGANIDMEGVDYTPIYEFRGIFDGKGYTISNIELPLDGATIYLTDGNWVGYSVTAIGLISSAYDAQVKNLTLDNVTANFDTGSEIFIGAIVGYAIGVEVVDCSVSSSMVVKVTHETVAERSISGVAGVIGYSLDAHVENTTVSCTIDYTANSYEAFLGALLGVGNVRVYNCNITLDLSFVGDMFGHTGSIIGMERTPDEVPLSTMMDSVVKGKIFISNRGYDWGEVGQGYLFHPDSEEIINAKEFNEIDVEKTYG